jgi:hypothetical protein
MRPQRIASKLWYCVAAGPIPAWAGPPGAGRQVNDDGGGPYERGGPMSAATFLGLIAACCTTLAYAPQAIKAL